MIHSPGKPSFLLSRWAHKKRWSVWPVSSLSVAVLLFSIQLKLSRYGKFIAKKKNIRVQSSWDQATAMRKQKSVENILGEAESNSWHLSCTGRLAFFSLTHRFHKLLPQGVACHGRGGSESPLQSLPNCLSVAMHHTHTQWSLLWHKAMRCVAVANNHCEKSLWTAISYHCARFHRLFPAITVSLPSPLHHK